MSIGSWFVVGMIALSLAIVGAIALFTRAWWRKRASDLESLANEQGWGFVGSPGEVRAVLPEIGPVSLFDQGDSKWVANLMRDRRAQPPVCLFDYGYSTGSGKQRTNYAQTVAAFDLGERGPFPAFVLRSETIWDKIGGWFRYEDIDFEERPEFSKRYLLKGQDEDRIRRLFRDEVLEWFEQVVGLGVESDGRWLIVFRPKKLVKPADVIAWREEAGAAAAVLNRAMAHR